MSEFFHAAGQFFHHLAAVSWVPIGLALACHYARILSRIPAWRNIIRAAYPGTPVPWRGVYASYVAGIGVNAIVPARGGDVLKLYLIKRRVADSTYPTLASTLVVETIFDTLAGAGVLVWALTQHVLPSFGVQKVRLPQVDWSWPLRNPKAAIVIGVVWLAFTVVLVVIGVRRTQKFWRSVQQGFAIVRTPGRYLTGVATWQALSWACRAGTIFFFLRAFHVPATARNVALVLAIQGISTLLPFTPGGVGTQQGFLVYVFRRVEPKVAESIVLSFSVGMYIAVTALNVVLGFAAIFASLKTFRFRKIVVDEKEKAYARNP